MDIHISSPYTRGTLNIILIEICIIHMITRHPCHACRRACPRGRAPWPCVPRRVHVGPRAKTFFFIINFFIILTNLKIENKSN